MSCEIRTAVYRALWLTKELYTFKPSCAASNSHLTSRTFSKILLMLERNEGREVSHVNYLSPDAERICHHEAILTNSNHPASPISSSVQLNGIGLYFV